MVKSWFFSFINKQKKLKKILSGQFETSDIHQPKLNFCMSEKCGRIKATGTKRP